MNLCPGDTTLRRLCFLLPPSLLAQSTFDLAEEYVQVLYRQFVVLLGVSVYPTIVVLAAVAYLLEYWLDKARLVYLCKRPEFREEPLSAKLVMAAHVFLAIAARFPPPR